MTKKIINLIKRLDIPLSIDSTPCDEITIIPTISTEISQVESLLASSQSITPPLSEPKETIGSFDIGMKNLSVCLIDHYPNQCPTFRVRKWDLISLVDQSGTTSLKCKHKIYPRTASERSQAKKGRGNKGYRLCGTKAGWWNPESGLGYCGSHKADEEGLIRYTTVKNVSDMELNRSLIKKLLEIPDLWQTCKTVVLEAQKTSKMKKIVAMIMSFLTLQTVLNPDNVKLTNIQVISAMHKLQLPINKLGMGVITLPSSTEKGLSKDSYDGRKELAIMHCEILLKNDKKHLEYFKLQKKKDDLADSFLQGLCHLLKHSK